MSSPPSDGDPIVLIIRFSTPTPDLRLSIASPQSTTASSLSTLIRPQLPPELKTCPLRYIYAGALLPPKTPLAVTLRLQERSAPAARQFYMHCSISTASQLTPLELAAERDEASRLASSPSSPVRTTQHAVLPPAAPPQGFDRLLSAGFTPTEVASLRSHFTAIQSHAHTPDTMPTGADLRRLEERWLDSNNSGGSGEAADEGDGTLAGGTGGLEDILWGNIMGFFWTLGAILWLVREEGVWSRRRQLGVLTGVLVNFAFCIIRAGG